jgi:hypothetical protein
MMDWGARCRAAACVCPAVLHNIQLTARPTSTSNYVHYGYTHTVKNVAVAAPGARRV